MKSLKCLVHVHGIRGEVRSNEAKGVVYCILRVERLERSIGGTIGRRSPSDNLVLLVSSYMEFLNA